MSNHQDQQMDETQNLSEFLREKKKVSKCNEDPYTFHPLTLMAITTEFLIIISKQYQGDK